MTLRAAPALAALLVATIVGGCATTPTIVASDGLNLDTRRERLQHAAAWEIRGRLAADTGDRGFQGSFQWRQDGDKLALTVRGPLGGGVLEVAGTPTELKVTARGETHVLTDPEPELSALVGWWLPVASLRSWLLGLPDPQFPAATEPGADGTLAALEQRLWHVRYPTYQLASEPGASATATMLLVPRRIDMEYGELHLRLTVDEWRATQTP